MSDQTPAERTTFEQRLMSRVRDSMGDLMTDEDMKKIIERSIEKTLFEKRVDTEKTTSYTTFYKPPMMEEIVTELFREQMQKAVLDWLEKNPKAVEEHIQQVINEGVLTGIISALEYRFSNLTNSIANLAVENGFMNRGI